MQSLLRAELPRLVVEAWVKRNEQTGMPAFERVLVITVAGSIEKAGGRVAFATAAVGAAIELKTLFLQFFRRCISKRKGHHPGVSTGVN